MKKPHPVFIAAGSAALLIYLPWKVPIFSALVVVWCAIGLWCTTGVCCATGACGATGVRGATDSFCATGVHTLWRKSGRATQWSTWFALAVGIWLGLLDYSYGALAVPQYSLPREKIHGVELRIIGDTSSTKNGNTMAAVNLLAVTGDDGARVSARGRLTLVVAGSWTAIRGTVIHACASADALEKGMVFARADELAVLREGSRFETLRMYARRAVMAALARSTGKASPLVKALIVGYRSDLDAESIRIFTEAGCAHILALSGQHVAVLVCIMGALARFLSGKRGEYALCAGSLVLFAWLTGASPSVVRAVVQYCLAGLFIKLDRPQTAPVVLCYTFVFACLLFPGSAKTLSFELSYLAAGGILVCSKPVTFFLRKYLPLVVAQALAVGFGAMAGTALLSVLVFGSVNLLAPITSALLGPLITALIWTGIFGAAAGCVLPALARISCSIAESIQTMVLFLVKVGSAGCRVSGLGFFIGFSVLACMGIVLYCYQRAIRRRVWLSKEGNEKTYTGRTREPLFRSFENLRAPR